ncbi:nuclease-related domain-containing protein [Sinomonas halotolerans]|uniref:Nuclease-related domain-containing protein n=1 Tax=Sinomonas halotolerans TaxID=1644133 RepID=A0ABU9X5Q2_9MICC
MRLRYAGTCRACGASLPARAPAFYEGETKTVLCLECGRGASESAVPAVERPPEGVPSAAAGAAGASARREYERRRVKDEERLREKWGRLGGLAVALSDERQSTAAWERGAVGEERLGSRLDSLAGDGVALLHDRRIPGSKANIDHIAVTPAGIWVIDAKRYKGRPQLQIEGGIFRPRVEKLVVGCRDSTKLVDGVLKQVDAVREAVEDVPVMGVLCFVEADWPLIGGSFSTRGVHVLWPKRLVRLLAQQDEGDVDVPAIREAIAGRFRPA